MSLEVKHGKVFLKKKVKHCQNGLQSVHFGLLSGYCTEAI